MHLERVAELRDLHKSFRSGLLRRPTEVLRGVDLDLRAGEVLALLGLNGAGKSTLMKIVLGLVRPTRGEGAVLGRPLGDRAARAGIGYQPEQPYLYPALTVKETLDFMAGLSRLSGRRRVDRLAAVIDLCSLERRLSTPVRRLSRGWLQRLTLAAALLPDPQLLLLDEPLGGLDPGGRLAVKEIVRSLRSRGRTVLLNTHALPDVETLADRAALLHDGRIVACGTLAALLTRSREGLEIEVASPGPVRLPGVCLSVWEPATGRSLWWVAEADPIAQQRTLAELIERGVQICAVQPRRQDLESFFAEITAAPVARMQAAARAS